MIAAPQILTGTPVGPIHNDCACPDHGFVPNRLRPESSKSQWQIAPNLYRAPLPDHHELIFDPVGFSNVVVLNETALAILDSFAVPRPLDDQMIPSPHATTELHAAIHRFVDLGLLQPIGYQHKLLQAQPTTLTAWLHVTNACNLRCTYCYLHKTDDAMDQETGIAAVNAVFRSAVKHGFKGVKLKYAGGEATLNFPLVLLLHQHAQKLAESSGIALQAVVLSNGVALSTTMIQQLRDNDIQLMISLDGVGDVNDAQRVFANGRGSFRSVAHAIKRAVNNGLQPVSSITVTGRNADHLSEIVSFMLDYDLRFNLNFYRENDCAASHQDLVADQARIIAGMKAAFAVIEARQPRQRLIDNLLDHSSFNEPHEHSCGAGHTYLVIDQQGGVARCQMEIEQTITSVHVADPLSAVRSQQISFMNVPVSEKQGCRDCSWRYWCAGGCSLLTFRATGRNDIKSPYCHVYQALYPDLLRLEGLRLLKWGELAA